MHYTIQCLNCVLRYLNEKNNWLKKLLKKFEMHSNESAFRKSSRLGLEQVYSNSPDIHLSSTHFIEGYFRMM